MFFGLTKFVDVILFEGICFQKVQVKLFIIIDEKGCVIDVELQQGFGEFWNTVVIKVVQQFEFKFVRDGNEVIIVQVFFVY